MTREQEAEQRKQTADRRMNKADSIRRIGSLMMIVGGCAVAVIMSINIAEPEIPTWLRGNAFTAAGMLYLTGAVFYIGGQILQCWLAQAADDRAAAEERHEEGITIWRDIKRNQTFLLARPGAEGAAGTFHHVDTPAPSADTLELVRRQRWQRRLNEEIKAAEPEPGAQRLHDEIREYLNRREDPED